MDLRYQHQNKSGQQKQTGYPDCAQSQNQDETAAHSGAKRKEKDNAEIVQCFGKILPVVRDAAGAEGFHAAADISDTHGAGKGIAVHFPESLHLHGAGKGYQGVCRKIQRLRKKSDKKQQKHLQHKDKLPPVQPPLKETVKPPRTPVTLPLPVRPSGCHLPAEMPDHLRRRHSEGKGEQRHEIAEGCMPVFCEKTFTEQNNISGLRVGKYAAAGKIRVGILQSARRGQKSRCQKGFGHLSVRR